MDLDLGGLPLAAVRLEGGVVVDANAAALRLGPHAAVGELLAKWFDPADEPALARALDRTASAQAGPAFARARDADRWVEVHAAGAGPDDSQVVLLRDATDERFVRAAVDQVADSTFVIRGDGLNRWRSAGLRQRSLQSDAEAARTPAGERIHPEDLPRVFEAFASVTEAAPVHVVARSRAVDDDNRWETIELVVWNRLEHEVLGGYLVQVHNLDEGRTIDTALGDADPGLLSLTEAAPVGIAVTDPAGQFVYRNPAARALLGPDVRSFADLDWVDLARPEHRPVLATAFDHALHEGAEQTVTAAFDGADGAADSWLRLRIEPQRAADGNHKGLIVTIEDVSDQVVTSAALEAAEERMRYLATHDSLTGLPNRAALNDELDRAAKRHERASTDLHVLFCDLDGFKPVNDRHGHAVGDAVLVEVAHRLRKAVRGADFVARLGGDEFVVLCETTGEDGDDGQVVLELTERLDAQVRRPIPVGDGTVSLGVSVGVATAPAGEPADPDTLLTDADEAMYRTKAARRRGRRARSARG